MESNHENESDQRIDLISVFELDSKIKTNETRQKKKKKSSYYGLVFALLAAIFLSISNVLVKKANFFMGTD